MVAIEGGEAAGEARLAVEKRTGKPVITNKNAAQLQDLVTGLIETINDKSDDQEGKCISYDCETGGTESESHFGNKNETLPPSPLSQYYLYTSSGLG
jgi:hypothetical protein